MNTKFTFALLIAFALSVASITAQRSAAGLAGDEKNKFVEFHNKVRHDVVDGFDKRIAVHFTNRNQQRSLSTRPLGL